MAEHNLRVAGVKGPTAPPAPYDKAIVVVKETDELYDELYASLTGYESFANHSNLIECTTTTTTVTNTSSFAVLSTLSMRSLTKRIRQFHASAMWTGAKQVVAGITTSGMGMVN